MGAHLGKNHPVAELVVERVAPVLAREGFDLVWVDYVPRSRVLRIYIDRDPTGFDGASEGQKGNEEQGVSIDDCSDMSRLVSDILDGEGISDRIDGRFTLEVSSPGLDRPLTRSKDFLRFEGQSVKVSTFESLEGRRKFSGKLVNAGNESFCVEVDGRSWRIEYGQVDKARLVPEY